MVSKIYNLLKYLNKFGYDAEFGYLLKLAAYTEEKLAELFPELHNKFYSPQISPSKAGGLFGEIKKKIDSGDLNRDEVFSLDSFSQLYEILIKSKFPDLYSRFYSHTENPNKIMGIFGLADKKLSSGEISSSDLDSANTFQDLLVMLKGFKKKKKESELSKYFNIMKNFKLSEDDIKAALQRGLTYKEIEYIVNDPTNHTWSEKIDMAKSFNDKKANHDVLNSNSFIYDYENIDSAISILHSKSKYGFKEIQEFYDKIEDFAVKTSEVIYNSYNYLVVHSKSTEAAQYWEQSCVTGRYLKPEDFGYKKIISPDGGKDRYVKEHYGVNQYHLTGFSTESEIEYLSEDFVDSEGYWLDANGNRKFTSSSGLCTASHDDNYFERYNKSGFILEVITKNQKTTSKNPRVKFDNKNKEYNLLSLSFAKKDGKLFQGGGSSVNRLNKDVTLCDLRKVLDSEYEDVMSSIYNYLKGWFDESDLTIASFEDFICKDEDYDSYLENLSKPRNESDLDKYMALHTRLDDKTFKSLKSIYSDLSSGEIQLFEIFVPNVDGLHASDTQEDLSSIDDSLINLPEAITIDGDKPEYSYVSASKIRSSAAKSEVDDLFENPNLRNLVQSFLSELSANNYFKLGLDEKYKDSYPDIFKENLAKVNSTLYSHLNLDHKYKDDYPNEHSKHEYKNYKKYISDKYKLKEPIDEHHRILQEYLEDIYNISNYKKSWIDRVTPDHIENDRNIRSDYITNNMSLQYFSNKVYDKEDGQPFEDNLTREHLQRLVDGDASDFSASSLGWPDRYKFNRRTREIKEKSGNRSQREENALFYFKNKLDEKFGYEYDKEIIGEMLSNLRSTDLFSMGLDNKYFDNIDLYQEEIDYIFSTLDSKDYFELNLDRKYKKKFPDIYKRKLLDFYSKEYEIRIGEDASSYGLESYMEKFATAYFAGEYNLGAKDDSWHLLRTGSKQYDEERAGDLLDLSLEGASANDYFYYSLDEKYPDRKDILKKNLNKIAPFEFFTEYMSYDNHKYKNYKEKYKDIYNLDYENTDNIFLDKKYANSYPEILSDKLNQIGPKSYFQLRLDQRYPQHEDILKHKLLSINPYLYLLPKWQGAGEKWLGNDIEFANNKLNLADLYGESFPDILIEQIKRFEKKTETDKSIKQLVFSHPSSRSFKGFTINPRKKIPAYINVIFKYKLMEKYEDLFSEEFKEKLEKEFSDLHYHGMASAWSRRFQNIKK